MHVAEDKYYGKAGLTYAEALAYERDVEQNIQSQFSGELEAEAVKLIHHSTLRKDELVNKVYDCLRQGNKAEAGQENAAEDSTDANNSTTPSASNITKKLLTQFLSYVADKVKPGVWIVKETWVQKHGLATELPQGMQVAAGVGAASSPAGAAAVESTPMKSPRKLKSQAADGSVMPFAPGNVPVRTLEEEEARLKPGSIKALAFQVMKAKGGEQPVTADDIIRITTTEGSKIDWGDKDKTALQRALTSDSAFARVARGQYVLRALAADIPLASPEGQQPVKATKPGPAPAVGMGDVSTGGQGICSSEVAEQAGLARAEHLLQQAEKAVAARKKDAAAADEALEVCLRCLKEAKAEALLGQAKASPAKGAAVASAAAGSGSADGTAACNGSSQPAAVGAAGCSAGDLDAMFALPERLKEYSGPQDDRKAAMAFRHEKTKELKRLAEERAAYVAQQRLNEAKAAKASTAQLQEAYERSKHAAEEAAAKLGRALKAEADARRAVEREKQREMLKDLKEKNKADKERQKQAEKEERERRRQEALAAKRYPIDDLELLAEELAAAAAAAVQGRADTGAAAAEGTAPGVEAASSRAVSNSPAVAANKEADDAAGHPLLPPEQLDLVCLSDAKHLSGAESLQLGQLLYVADTLSQFAKQLKVKGCSHADLKGLLAAAAPPAVPAADSSSSAGMAGQGSAGASAAMKDASEATDMERKAALQWLACTYQQLLKVLLTDLTDMDGAARVFHRWGESLDKCGSGCWPELVRRWVMLQQQDGLASREAAIAALFLRDSEAACLSPAQHLALLTQLLDDCLDTSLIRDMLAHRIDEAAEVAAGVKAELADARKRLRELADAEKESRKKKRAAALALATAAAERKLRERGELPPDGGLAAGNGDAQETDAVAAAAGDGGAEGTDLAAAGSKDKEKVDKKIQATTKEILQRVAGPGVSAVTLAELEAEIAGEVEVEPSWDLPPHLQEYGGPPGDKKAMSEFRRNQQEERKKLDKQRVKWLAGKKDRDRARAEAKKKEMEAERKLQQERLEAEEALAKQQESLEQQLERYLVRRQPLGNDRFNRMYWWGLAGNKDGLLLQQEVGCAEATVQLLQEAAMTGAWGAAVRHPHSADNMQQDGEPSPAAKMHQQQDHQVLDARAGGSCDQQEQEQLAASNPPGVLCNAAGGNSGRSLSVPLDHKGLLLPAGPEGWLVIDDTNQLEQLLQCLEQRGVRERDLKTCLDKMMPVMSSALAKAAAAKAAAEEQAAMAAAAGRAAAKKEKEKQQLVPREMPSRHARVAAAEQIRKTGTASAKQKEPLAGTAAAAAHLEEDEDEKGPLHGWQLTSVRSAVKALIELSEAAAAAKAACPPPSTTWAQYRKQLEACIGAEDSRDEGEEADAERQPDEDMQLIDEKDAESAQGLAEQQSARTGRRKYGDTRLYKRRGTATGTAEDSMDIDDNAQQKGADDARGSNKAAAGASPLVRTGSGRSSKRSAAGGVVGAKAEHLGARQGDDHGDKLPEEAGSKRAKRGKEAGLPPRPQVSGGSKAGKQATAGKSAATAAALGECDADDVADEGAGPASREGSVASAEVAAAGRGSSRKGRQGGAAAAATSSEPAGQQPALAAEVEQAAASSKKQARQLKSRSRKGQTVAAPAAVDMEGMQPELGADDVNVDDGSSSDQNAAGAKGSRGRQGNLGGSTATAKQVSDVAGMASAQDNNKQQQEADGDAGLDQAGSRRRSLLHHQQCDDDGQLVEPDEEVVEEADSNLPARLLNRAVWRAACERDSWRNGVAAAATTAGLGFCAAALLFHSLHPLQVVTAEASKTGKRS
eukprot:gene7967-8165_t